MIRSAALDLGSLAIKGGRLRDDGTLEGVVSRPAPALRGEDPIRESVPAEHLAAATSVRDEVMRGLPAGTPFGLASQRSTFLLWDAASGEPRTPVISWQDRRAAGWCDRHADLQRGIAAGTGLRLSPHYAGPKLAHLLESDRGLRESVRRGELRFGTLETWLIRQWSGGASHETDLTMAARTLLADPRSGRWTPEVLPGLASVASLLPRIVPTAGRATRLSGGSMLTASIGDQAAAALAAIGGRRAAALVNLGTGGFVLRLTGGTMDPRSGYLAGPVLGDERGGALFSQEGTINGAAAAIDRFGSPPTDLPETDRSPESFALPDVAGIGSPHWRPGAWFTLSPVAQALDVAGCRRVVLEGILFRVREILEDLFPGDPPEELYLAGGLARDPAVAAGLAACLGRPVERLEDENVTLLGIARLAAGVPPADPPVRARRIDPGPAGAYLPAKFPRWKRWLARLLRDA